MPGLHQIQRFGGLIALKQGSLLREERAALVPHAVCAWGSPMSAASCRLPDEVRAAAVRAWLFLSWTVVSLTMATLASYGRSPLLTPSLVSTAVGVFGTVWCLLDVLIARQIAAQRRRGPNSASPLAGSREPKQRRPARRESRSNEPKFEPTAFEPKTFAPKAFAPKSFEPRRQPTGRQAPLRG